MEQVIAFYDAGGGLGRKLSVANQTLSADSLRLTEVEKKDLILFIHSLDENIVFDTPPPTLPHSSNKLLNTRNVGGDY
jgi:cytochrome c peroxidase